MVTQPRLFGFVYVLTNRANPGLVKVGRTGELAEDRANALYRGRSGVAAPFDVAFRAATSHPERVERRAHQLLSSHRFNPSREFFAVATETAVEAVRQALVDAGGLTSWQDGGTQMVMERDRLALTLEAGQAFALLSVPDLASFVAKRVTIIDLWQAHADGDLLELLGTPSPEHVAGLSDGDPGATDDPVPFLDREQKVENGFINGRERLMPGERLVWLPAPDAPAEHHGVIFEADGHCQVVSRTWSPVIGEYGLPCLLNEYRHDEMWPAAERAVREALALPMPRSWAPRSGRGDDWAPLATSLPPSVHWLSQLAPKRRNARKRQ